MYHLRMNRQKTSLLQYIEHIQTLGEYWFSRKNALKALSLKETSFTRAAHRLIESGKLKRIRGDFYIIIPPEYRAVGSLPASWFIDALMKHLNQDYYIGLLTAASLDGASHQQPMVFQVITNKPIRPIQAGKLIIEFFYKKEISPVFIRPVKTVSGSMSVSTPEMTAFDLIKYMDSCGHLNHVGTVLLELLEKINLDILTSLLNNECVEIVSAQRLGYLLEFLKPDIDLSDFLNELKKKELRYRLLIPMASHEPILYKDERWKILVNANVEPDEI